MLRGSYVVRAITAVRPIVHYNVNISCSSKWFPVLRKAGAESMLLMCGGIWFQTYGLVVLNTKNN